MAICTAVVMASRMALLDFRWNRLVCVLSNRFEHQSPALAAEIFLSLNLCLVGVRWLAE